MSTPSATASGQTRRLYRSRDDRVAGGVCGGLGRYFELDPVLVRIVVAALCLLGGVGIVAYLAAWLLVPEEGQALPLLHTTTAQPIGRWRMIAGAALLAVSVLVVVKSLFPDMTGKFVWPLVLGLAGAVLVLSPERGGAAAPAPGATAEDDAPPAGAGDAPLSGSGEPEEPEDEEDRDAHTTAVAAIPPSAPPARFSTPSYGGAPDPRTQPTAVLPPPVQPPQESRRERRRTRRTQRRSPSARVALGLALLVGAALIALAAWAPSNLGWDTALGIVVIAWGAIVAVASFWGRATGLVVLGFLVAAVAALLAGASLNLRGGVGDHRAVPTGAMPVSSTYEMAAGKLGIDLRHATFRPGTTTIDAKLGLGRLTVIVPADARVVIHATLQAGNLETVDRFTDGTDLTRNLAVGPLSGPTIVLNATLGLGSLEIRRGDPPWPTRDGGRIDRAAVGPSSPLPLRSNHARS